MKLYLDPSRVDRAMRKVARAGDAGADAGILALGAVTVNRLIDASPVHTGQYQGGWIRAGMDIAQIGATGLDLTGSKTSEDFDPTAQAAGIALGSAELRKASGEVSLTLRNGVPYATQVEGGTPGAPDGVVGPVISRLFGGKLAASSVRPAVLRAAKSSMKRGR